jgi:phosphoesterase RecJ-like protein
VGKSDLLIVLDAAAWNQLGDMAEVIRNAKIAKAVIDHHVSGEDLGGEVFKDASAEATGRLVVEAADHLGVALTADIARPLFCALATDTGWFRFSSATARTYALAARLVDAGARPDELYRALYENDTLSRLHLAGRSMARATTLLDGRLIYTSIAREDFDALGAEPADSEDIINATLCVSGTEVALIFIEQSGGDWRVSFRSRSDVDVRAIASRFGGGGHVRAAGATVAGPWPRARDAVLDAVLAAMR